MERVIKQKHNTHLNLQYLNIYKAYPWDPWDWYTCLHIPDKNNQMYRLYRYIYLMYHTWIVWDSLLWGFQWFLVGYPCQCCQSPVVMSLCQHMWTTGRNRAPPARDSETKTTSWALRWMAPFFPYWYLITTQFVGIIIPVPWILLVFLIG